MRRILEKILAFYAKITLHIHRPKIVGITGSVGKSSAKEAIALVLAKKYKVRSSPGNLNSQIGLPLAVLGFKASGGFKKNLASTVEWFGILIAGFFRIFQTGYPEVLVLEMGTDKPGDIVELCLITGKIDRAVITDIGISHLEFFASPEQLAREKLSLLKFLKKTGAAILNRDNPKIAAVKNFGKNILTYGFDESDVRAQDLSKTQKNGVFGMTFKVSYRGHKVPFFIPESLGKPQAYACLAASAVGLSFGMNLVEISSALENFKSPPGRLKLIEGINNSIIIDDTYNAAPSSTLAALQVLSDFNGQHKIACIGDMAELGRQTEKGHREVGSKIYELGIDDVYLVGPKSKLIEDELILLKFPGRINWFKDSDQAKTFIRESLEPESVILVKGSQASRMEKIVKAIMLKPEDASKLLVRQSKQWE